MSLAMPFRYTLDHCSQALVCCAGIGPKVCPWVQTGAQHGQRRGHSVCPVGRQRDCIFCNCNVLQYLQPDCHTAEQAKNTAIQGTKGQVAIGQAFGEELV